MAICPFEVCRPRVIPLVFHRQQSGPWQPHCSAPHCTSIFTGRLPRGNRPISQGLRTLRRGLGPPCALAPAERSGQPSAGRATPTQ